MSAKPQKRRVATQRVLNAAMQWHHWLTVDGVGADYHAYARAFKRLKLACANLKKVSRK